MKSTQAKRIAVATFFVAATSGGVAVAAAHSSPGSSHWTPNDCITLNHGDYNACNVGNSGNGTLPYQR